MEAARFMVEVIPFKGITYNKDKIKRLDDVMAPPYDIVSEEMQDYLYKKNEYNFVRLTLNKITSEDDEKNNRYTRARDLFALWLKNDVLVESDTPGIYPYKIRYAVENQEKTMNGFFVLLKLDPDYKMVKAHERTLSKPKVDRLNLMRACKTNFEPIQLLYIDDEDEIRKKIDHSIKEPIIDVEGYDGFNHKLWKIEDEDVIEYVQDFFRDKILFIADGHHRYQTAVDFAREMREATGDTDDSAPFNYRMVVLVNMFDKGLSILPTHRLVKKPGLDLSRVFKKLEKYFVVEKRSVDADRSAEEIAKRIKKDIETDVEHKFAVYMKNKYYVLTLKDEKTMDEFASDKSKIWRTLDVSILHKIVFEYLMDIDQRNIEHYVRYTRVDEEAVRFVDDGRFDFSVLMNATKIDELKAVADAGEHMPQKSTYFLPKMLSGLVLYKM